ncbi:MAG: hypothetical protein R2742_00550 [Micropruina glycogenica]
MHGFIAEVAEVGVGNARSQIAGAGAVYQWVNDNKAVDLVRSGVEIQQKFYASRFGLAAILSHLQRYPDFIENGGKYQVPPTSSSDSGGAVRHALRGGGQFLTRSGGPSLSDWERIQVFFKENSLGIESLEPSNLEYCEVQRGIYSTTLDAEKVSPLHRRVSRDAAYQQNDRILRRVPKRHWRPPRSRAGPLSCWPWWINADKARCSRSSRARTGPEHRR